ncbi:hypothetical protein PAPYR_6542 [Paratrimastix pyriformis]|uniref:START domain-containing protein n=1 Tax=Paratrimastix pyriformis TaxID=342808 RepID=A0ABQ8UKN4_9EUKA|nr:hypothetical protein PAPYR_6542 [Paratrimastix pyriformis]
MAFPTTEQLVVEFERFLQEGWAEAGVEDGVQRFTKDLAGSSLKAFKGSCLIEKPVAEVLAALKDWEHRPAWDESFLGGRVIQPIDATTDIIYQVKLAGGPASNRDMCMIRLNREFDGKVYVITKSVPHPDCPPVDKLVRAEVTIAGFSLVPEGAGCRVAYAAAMNPGGWVPGFLANRVGQKQPLIVAALRKHLTGH